VRIFDSHAIMLYLAEEHHRFIPDTNTDQAQMLSWLMLVATGLSPFSGQAAHFLHYAPEVIPYARNRYVKEVARHYTVLDQHLAHSRYLAGNEYSIADMALWGWGISAGYIFGEQGLKDYPNVLRLVDEISIRPAAIRVKALRDQLVVKTDVDEVAIRSLFPQNY
jgi:GST-like protein